MDDTSHTLKPWVTFAACADHWPSGPMIGPSHKKPDKPVTGSEVTTTRREAGP
jgi:hypothetical protein